MLRASCKGPLRAHNSRLTLRSFSTETAHRAEEHHTYFHKDAKTVNFPEHTKILQRDHGSWSATGYARNRIATAFQSSRSQNHGDAPREGHSKAQIWTAFFSGFLLFPLVYTYAWTGKWAFGVEAPASEMASFEQQGLGASTTSASSTDQFMEAHNLYQILQRANAETKALHDLIHLLINPAENIRAFRDRATVDAHPIRMSSGQILDPSKVTLVNILDKKGKTLALLLGVDMQGHNGSESDPNLDWCHDYALRQWMDERAAAMKENGTAAGAGIGLFCYTATSSATSLPGRAEDWQEARLFPQDLPEGFPLKAFEKIPPVPTVEEFSSAEKKSP